LRKDIVRGLLKYNDLKFRAIWEI